MVYLVESEQSNFFSTQDRYFISDAEAALFRQGEKGVKRASGFERLMGRSVKVVIDGKDLYLEKASLSRYLSRRLKRVAKSYKGSASEAVEGFIRSSRINAFSTAILRGQDAAKKRGRQLKKLSRISLKDRKIDLIDGNWHAFYESVSREVVDIIFGSSSSVQEPVKWEWGTKLRPNKVIHYINLMMNLDITVLLNMIDGLKTNIAVGLSQLNTTKPNSFVSLPKQLHEEPPLQQAQ